MNVILFDDPIARQDLLPFTFTRPISALRVGILTIAQKWERWLQANVSPLTADYLQEKFPTQYSSDNLYLNACICPDQELLEELIFLGPEQGLFCQGKLLALRTSAYFYLPEHLPTTGFKAKELQRRPTMVTYPWEIFVYNKSQIAADFPLVTAGRESQPILDRHTIVYGEENLFVEEGVEIRASILNAEKGPIYIGKDVLIQEGTIVQGSAAFCEHVQTNVMTKIRPNCTFGPYSKVGGEVGDVVFLGYSNKVHDGYMGTSVIGEWCNLGADSNTSNLKNNYSEVRIWNYRERAFVRTGQQFCGLMMGDHSKAGINTMFNTGTVVGVSANVFGAGFPPKHIPSFAWGGMKGDGTADLDKMMQVAERVMGRRNLPFTEVDRRIMQHVYAMTEIDRQTPAAEGE